MLAKKFGLGAATAVSSLLVAAAAGAQPPAATSPGAPPSGAPTEGVQMEVAAETQADTGEKPGEDQRNAKPKPLPWRGTSLVWDQSATTDTVGVGQDRQSENPTYEMTFSIKPAYYLIDEDRYNISLRGDAGAFREFTNSDETTKRGEWSLTDFTLYAAYARKLYTSGDYATLFTLRAPVLSFPTSRISAANGKILGLGADVGIGQSVPVLGSESSVLQTFTAQATAGYTHTFTEAIEPTATDLQRVRMDPSGRSIPGDQLGGVAFAEHQATFGIAGELAITDRVAWSNSFSWRPSWKYELPDTQVRTSTGDVQPDGVDDPQRFTVVTLFASEVGVRVLDEMSLALGYANLTSQIAPDGTRRNVFYSPYARFYLSVTAHLDEIYLTASGSREKQSARASGRQVAGAPAAAVE